MTEIPAGLTGEALAQIAIDAGAAIDRLYRDGCAATQKHDLSPVTDADSVSEEIILAGLHALAPDLPVIAEERAAAGDIPNIGDIFALVDPLDGTKEFIIKSGEFTVNIAIIAAGVPVVGVVYAPAIGRLWVAAGGVAWSANVVPGQNLPVGRVPLAVRSKPADGLTVLVSRSHGAAEADAYLQNFAIAERIAAGSSLKFCRVAEGVADLYPRFGRTMEWDTAAGHAIVLAAGGVVLTLDGAPLRYGKTGRGYDNPSFVVLGDSALFVPL